MNHHHTLLKLVTSTRMLAVLPIGAAEIGATIETAAYVQFALHLCTLISVAVLTEAVP